MLRNDTENTYQLLITVGKDYLEGELRVSAPMTEKYRIKEKNHRMEPEYWGGYSRHNQLYQQIYSLDGELLETKPLVENHAIMMYSPFLDAPPTACPDESESFFKNPAPFSFSVRDLLMQRCLTYFRRRCRSRVSQQESGTLLCQVWDKRILRF